MRYSNSTRLAVGALLGATVLAACSSASTTSRNDEEAAEPVRGGSVTIARAADIGSWDPDTAFTVQSLQTLPMVMEGLLRPDPEAPSGVSGGLAEEWEVEESGRTITFHLRDGATFSDGSPVTAADVVFSVEQWQQNVGYGPLYASITGATALSDDSVAIELKQPSSVTLSWIGAGASVIVPKDFGGRTREDFYASPVGAGPFMVDEYKPGQTLTMVRNPHYYDDERPYLDSITYEIVADANQRLLQYQRGDIDVIEAVPADVADVIPESDRYVVHPASTVQSAWFNLQRSPTDDVRFRRAVSFAIDRDAYVDAVYRGFAEVAGAALPQGVEGSAACECDDYSFDPERARAELAESGYDGEEIVMLAPGDNPVLNRGSQIVEQMLEDVGINIALQPVELEVMNDLLMNGEYHLNIADMSSVSPSVGDVFSLMPYMIPGLDEEATATINNGFADLDAATDQASGVAATQRLEQWWAEEQPYVPIANPDRIVALGPEIHGFAATSYLMYPADQLWRSGQ
ncbi:ABC transporter substrate-binding protein [Jiangella muralis]|uniref:ABC transporter substrate-binding protein n=1 Tax=Jiangella muralis TaxID=702383 RepID=UPI00069CC493|nr:ABC transporter substrate-binding protein [Jiangella muralis]